MDKFLNFYNFLIKRKIEDIEDVVFLSFDYNRHFSIPALDRIPGSVFEFRRKKLNVVICYHYSIYYVTITISKRDLNLNYIKQDRGVLGAANIQSVRGVSRYVISMNIFRYHKYQNIILNQYKNLLSLLMYQYSNKLNCIICSKFKILFIFHKNIFVRYSYRP
jgi:hypothetical protein